MKWRKQRRWSEGAGEGGGEEELTFPQLAVHALGPGRAAAKGRGALEHILPGGGGADHGLRLATAAVGTNGSRVLLDPGQSGLVLH